MKYTSIIPTEMSEHELRSIIGELFTAKNWNQKEATIELANGHEYKMEVERISDYREELELR